jgi:hypothetical protein
VRINDAFACTFYIGAVQGSVFVRKVRGCVFHVATRQIRIHDAENVDFYVHAMSRPIIEDCSKLRFAPFNLAYKGLAAHLRKAGLIAAATVTVVAENGDDDDDNGVGADTGDDETAVATAVAASDLWCSVDDFKWHRQTASPNWCVMPVADRKGLQNVDKIVADHIEAMK